ncbi:hypothetical protein EV360DRAFT_73669 [Lentinula raphanica]|nr:hypothetical protein EV360DRAFT_73669 [Lentinula raphanica]
MWFENFAAKLPQLKRDNITAKKQVLFLPLSKHECNLLQRAWPSYSNSFGSAYELARYSGSDTIEFPQTPAKDYKTQVPETFYPALLIQSVEGFEQGPVCREEGYLLYWALVTVQEALADVMDEPKTKTKDALLAMLKDSSVTKALGYYWIFWHKSWLCPLFALCFVSLFCDFCEKTLTKAEYMSRVYNKDTRQGVGVNKALCAKIRVLRHPVTNTILLPDPSGVAGLPPASPLLNAWEDDDFSNEGPVSPLNENQGPVSPVPDPDKYDDGKTEASDDIEVEDIFKAPKGKGKAKASMETPICHSPQVRPSKASSAKVGPPVASRPVPKPTKCERDTSSPVADVEMQEPLPKKARTSVVLDKASKETLPPQVADTAVSRTSKSSKATRNVLTEPEVPLEHNDLDAKIHHALFLTNPNFQVKTAFADFIEQDSGVKHCPEMQILRSSPWTINNELKKLGAFLTMGGVSFSLDNLGRFGHLQIPTWLPLWTAYCASALHLKLQSDLLQDLPKSVQSLPGAQELAQEMFNFLAGYNLASLVRDLKVAGLDANVVLTAWAKEHPNDKLSYDDTTLFATFFNWNSSCNLSNYLKKLEEIAKFQQFLKDHQLDLPSNPSTLSEAITIPIEPSAVETKKSYSAMHASNWDAEAAAKPDEPSTPITEEQKP